ncbi:SpoIIE family protein phosphatase [Microbispora siamensis]
MGEVLTRAEICRTRTSSPYGNWAVRSPNSSGWNPRTSATRESEIVNAGHIPPLLAGKGAAYHQFGNLLLGVAQESCRVDRVRLPEDATVLLFTDGLVEDRDKLLDESLEVARQQAEDVGDDLEGFCDRLIATFGAREDDVAPVAVRRVPF